MAFNCRFITQTDAVMTDGGVSIGMVDVTARDELSRKVTGLSLISYLREKP